MSPAEYLMSAQTADYQKGIHQSILLDESLPETGPMSQWSSRVVCEGGSSDPLNVPSHWHKVRKIGAIQ